MMNEYQRASTIQEAFDQAVAQRSQDMAAEAAKRTFGTGATRDTDDGKLDYEGFLSPIVLERFACYMHENRKMADGSLRSSDNWQKGIPKDVYMKSLWRHFMDLWLLHRGVDFDASGKELPGIDEALCALLFNVQGYLFEVLKDLDKDGEPRAL